MLTRLLLGGVVPAVVSDDRFNQDHNKPPRSVFVSMLQATGIESD